ncbi:Small subunit (SSU) processome component [Schaereria dolodes]|nr:Small subunit (SSU) processome component [Schaereria dolodes]
MVRKLKHHEQKLLRKVDFVTYKSDNNHRDAEIIRRYAIQKPSDYSKYNHICGSLRCAPASLPIFVSALPSHPFPPLTETVLKNQSPQALTSLVLTEIPNRQLAHHLSTLPPDDQIRHKHESLLLEKLYDMGILGTVGATGRGKLSEVEKKVSVSSLCRRRLGVVMTRLKMADTVQAAIKFIEQGHVRVGTDVITDPAFMVTRNMEDFVTWMDSSKIKRNILKYRDKLDDFDLL